MQGNRHAHVFCESNNALAKGIDGEITHITIYAPAGFESEDQRAVQDLDRVWGGDDLEIQVILQGFGQPQDYGGIDLERGQCPLLARSRAWVSRTPFLPTRHPKVTRAGALKRDASGLQIGSPRARAETAAGAGRLSEAGSGGAGGRHDAGRAEHSVACLPAPERDGQGKAGGEWCRLRLSDRVS